MKTKPKLMFCGSREDKIGYICSGDTSPFSGYGYVTLSDNIDGIDKFWDYLDECPDEVLDKITYIFSEESCIGIINRVLELIILDEDVEEELQQLGSSYERMLESGRLVSVEGHGYEE